MIAALLCMMVLSLALVGCGSSGGSTSGTSAGSTTSKGPEFVKTWGLTKITSDGDTLDTTSMLQYTGYFMTIEFKADGTYSYSDGTDVITGTWTSSATNKGNVTIQDQKMTMTLDNGSLVLDDGAGGSMTFEEAKADILKITTGSGTASTSSATAATGSATGTATSSAATSSASATSAATMNYVVCDDQYAKVVVTGTTFDSVWGAGYTMQLVNKTTDRTIWVDVEWGTSSVDGVMNDMTLGQSVTAGNKANVENYFWDEVPQGGLKNVKGTLRTLDNDSNELLASYPFAPTA